MRFDTHRVSAFLVSELQRARPHVEVTDHGGDIIHARLANGDMVYIYLIENPITVYEIRSIVEPNSARGVSSLFILWGELLLPAEGLRYRPDDWMAAFLALHGEKIYGFDPYLAEEHYIFPVYFEGSGHERVTRYGSPIHAGQLNWVTVETRLPGLIGQWKVADFEPRRPLREPEDAMHVFYTLLGLSRKRPTTREQVKRAYRRAARRLHPDVNAAHDATAQMQRLNDAYIRVLKEIEP